MGWLTLPALRGYAQGYESAHSSNHELIISLCNDGFPGLGRHKAWAWALDAVEAEAYKIGSGIGTDTPETR